MKPTFIKIFHYINIGTSTNLTSFQVCNHIYLLIPYLPKTNNGGRFSFHKSKQNRQRTLFLLFLKNSMILLILILFTIRIQFLIALSSLADYNEYYGNKKSKRFNEDFLPNGKFSVVTNEKLIKLQEFVNAVHDPKLYDLYRAVSHYVHMAKKNHEYVLWKYDANQGGLVLILKQDRNGILYYG